MLQIAQLRRLKFYLTNLNLRGVWLGWFLAIASTVAFSLATPLGKAAINLGVSPTVLLVLRFTIGLVLLVLTLSATAPGKLRVDRRGLLIIGGTGVMNGLGVLSFFWSLTRLDASIATMIFSLSPIAILAVLALGGEKLTYRQLIRLAIGLIGVYLLLGPGGQVDWLGVLLVCGNMVSISLEFAFIQWFARTYDSRTIALYIIAGMLITVGTFWLVQGVVWPQLDWQGWLVIGLMGLVTGYFAWWAMFAGLRYLGGGQVALLQPLETLLAVLWSVIFLQERLSTWQWFGGLLILISTVLAAKRLSRVK